MHAVCLRSSRQKYFIFFRTDRIFEKVGKFALSERHVLSPFVSEGNYSLLQKSERLVDVGGLVLGPTVRLRFAQSLRASQINKIQFGYCVSRGRFRS